MCQRHRDWFKNHTETKLRCKINDPDTLPSGTLRSHVSLLLWGDIFGIQYLCPAQSLLDKEREGLSRGLAVTIRSQAASEGKGRLEDPEASFQLEAQSTGLLQLKQSWRRLKCSRGEATTPRRSDAGICWPVSPRCPHPARCRATAPTWETGWSRRGAGRRRPPVPTWWWACAKWGLWRRLSCGAPTHGGGQTEHTPGVYLPRQETAVMLAKDAVLGV